MQNLHNAETVSPIVIFGCNEFAARLYKILVKNTKLNVIGFIDDIAAPLFCGKQVYSVESFKQANLPHIPIVIALPHDWYRNAPSIDLESVYQFKKHVAKIINTYALQNDLLHPAALIDFIEPSYPNKIIQFGLPGSGITLMSRIIAKIIEKNRHFFKNHSMVADFFEKMCFEYTHSIHQLLLNAVHLTGGYDFHMSPWKIGTNYAICTDKTERTEIYSLTTRNHIISPVYNYHQIPSQAYLQQLQDQQFKLFFCMRNPLDIILSCIKKANGINEAHEINMDLFCDYSRWVINQLHLWKPSLHKLIRLSYDKLMQNPVPEINFLMQQMDIRPSNRKANRIWESLAFKQLTAAPTNHFWEGGTGKWEQYFTKQHLAFLKDHGIEEVLAQFGYEEVLAQFKQYTTQTGTYEWQTHCSPALLWKLTQPVLTNFGDENHDTLQLLKNIHGEGNYLSADSFYVVANNNLSNQIKKLLNSDYVNKIFRAGTHANYHII